jgi:hypothetical protein
MFTFLGKYMWVFSLTGHIMINLHYFKNGDRIHVYLDIIHELVHIRQYIDGKELFDSNYNYLDRPTEIEAYSYAVKEAKRLGLKDEQICEYLRTERMSKKDLNRLARNFGIQC